MNKPWKVDEPNLLDLRTLNGNPSSTKFDEFWEEIMSDNLQTALHERRHNAVSYLPFAIGVRDLIEIVKKEDPLF